MVDGNKHKLRREVNKNGNQFQKINETRTCENMSKTDRLLDNFFLKKKKIKKTKIKNEWWKEPTQDIPKKLRTA